MILIIEGIECVGKTETVRALQNIIPLHTMIKFSGSPRDIISNEYMKNVYESTMYLFNALKRQNIILDRFTLTERVYSKLFKPYTVDYLDDYETWIATRIGAKLFYLHASEGIIKHRLERKSREFPNEKQPTMETLKVVEEEYEIQLQNSKIPVYPFCVDGLSPAEIADGIVLASGLDFSVPETAYTTLRSDQ